MFSAQRLQQSGHVRQPVDRAAMSMPRRAGLLHVARVKRRAHDHRQNTSVQGESQIFDSERYKLHKVV